jgi:hypothetical protein
MIEITDADAEFVMMIQILKVDEMILSILNVL